jgi:hypothetical protein
MTRKKKTVAEEPKSIVPVTEVELVKSGAKPDHEFDYEGEKGTYNVFSIGGEPLVETEYYRLVIAQNPSGQLGVAMVATSVDNNPFVDRHVRMVNTLQTSAALLDTEAQAKDKKPLNYGALFPTALETFTSDDGRLGVFLGYHPVIKTYKQLVPMCIALENKRVDLKSAAWILGKGLKLLDFLHYMDFTLGFVHESNLFLETTEHGVFALDLTTANEDATNADKLAEVGELAKVVWSATGGTDTDAPPYDESIMTPDEHAQFVGFLKALKDGSLTAREAHTAAYIMYDQIWPKQPGGSTGGLKRDWHEWVTYPRA